MLEFLSCVSKHVRLCACVCLRIHLQSFWYWGGEQCQGHEYGKDWEDWEGVICCVSHQFCLVKRSQQSHPTLLQGHITDPLIHLPHPPLPDSRLFSSAPFLPPASASHLSLPLIISPERWLSLFSLINCALCMIADTHVYSFSAWTSTLFLFSPLSFFLYPSFLSEGMVCEKGIQILLTTVGAFAAFGLMTVAIGTDYWLYSRALICNSTANVTQDDPHNKDKKDPGALTHSGLWRICCLEGRE